MARRGAWGGRGGERGGGDGTEEWRGLWRLVGMEDAGTGSRACFRLGEVVRVRSERGIGRGREGCGV